MGKSSESQSSQYSSQVAEDNRLAAGGFGNTGTISGSTVYDSSTNFDSKILDSAYQYLYGADALMTDRAFATLAVADNTAQGIIDASGKFAETSRALSSDMLSANNNALNSINNLAGNTIDQSLGQATSLANIGKDFSGMIINAASRYSDNAFKSGMDATGAAYNAVSEINSAASDGSSVLPDFKQQVIVALVSGAVIYAFTKGK